MTKNKWKPLKVFSYCSPFSGIRYKNPRWECSRATRKLCGTLHKTRQKSLEHCKELEAKMNNILPKCPKCKSNEKVKPTGPCKCGSCPPWVCMNCLPYENAGHKGYDFYEEKDKE